MRSEPGKPIEEVIEPIGEKFSPASTDDIRQIEDIVKARLPPSYVSFLTRIGSCMFSGWATVNAANGEELGIFTFFGGAGSVKSIVEDLRAHEDYVAAKLVPIADNNFNDRYVLEATTGKIHYIEYRDGTHRVVEAANSFEDFLQEVRVEPYDDAL